MDKKPSYATVPLRTEMDNVFLYCIYSYPWRGPVGPIPYIVAELF
jgi:hypothetical protein